MLCLLVPLLGVGVLASERYQLTTGPQPSSWLLQLPVPSLVSCTARCGRLEGCSTVVWSKEDSCRLAADATDVTSASESSWITVYRRVADPGTDERSSTATQDDTSDGDKSEASTSSEEVGSTEDPLLVLPAAEAAVTTVNKLLTEGVLTGGTSEVQTSTALITTTTASPVVSCPSQFTLVDGHCYRHLPASPPVNFEEARALCASLATGGELGGLYTQAHLDFFWRDGSRPNNQQWIGLQVSDWKWRNLLDNSRPDIPDFTDLMEGSTWNIQLSLPGDLVTGKLIRTARSTSLGAVVCETPVQL